ncbi:SPFH domain-containing protein [Helcobacillus massiliensis]|uniref:SPFH domain-containing protein n=1 Tax=Helcobacillus massiliensis TaxID=521392 RepID=UPI00255606B3|nr:SPFH domain-containing protein [Helcobacillus massiliensis]MDK7743052.1 SPFH domain-containing protein [Helcobacillus massiliensis]WOO91963.1 SPFH domain-containing protein [Helcobacillus massiliensis]
MGFIQAFTGALGGTFADQWLDFLTVPSGIAPTAALFPAVSKGTNAGRGQNTKGSESIISNGSKIVVPPGYGLITMEDGRTTGLITEPGGYIWASGDPNSRSVFAGNGIIASTVSTTWERFKFGGQPGSQQLAMFVSLKELPNNRFGTQSEIYWDDRYMNAQVGAVARGSYTMKIVDPLLFVHNWVPARHLQPNAQPFDFTDMSNDAADQPFREVVASLAAAFSKYTNDEDKDHRITRIQQDSMGLAQALGAAVEENYRWAADRGLVIVKVAMESIEYDEDTRRLLSDVKKADALSGDRSRSFASQAFARGVESAGQNGGGAGLAMMGMGAGALGGMAAPTNQTPFAGAQQGQQQAAPQQDGGAGQAQGGQTQGGQADGSQSGEDPVAKLAQFKQMLDQGLISQEDYDAAKNRALGL